MTKNNDLLATVRLVGLELRKCPEKAGEIALFALRLADEAREVACEKRREEARARRSRVIHINMQAGRTILPTCEYGDLDYGEPRTG
jgi:hypothetical protein